MSEYLTPAVYLEELSRSSDPRFLSQELLGRRRKRDEIGIVKSKWTYQPPVAAFVGRTAMIRHPAVEHKPTLVTSWRHYAELFGDLTPHAYLPYAVYGYFLNGGEQCYILSSGSQEGASPVRLLDALQIELENLRDISLLCYPDSFVPGQQSQASIDEIKASQLLLISICERIGDCFAILDSPPALGAQEIRDWRYRYASYDTSYAALYYPWIRIVDTDGRLITIPPSGHLAGIYVRNDLVRGVHTSPANELIRGALDLEQHVSLAEQEVLNPGGINVLRASPGRGLRVWGARTLSSDPRRRYIQTNRLLHYLKATIKRGSEWVLFQDARDRTLWAQIEYDLEDLLKLLWRSGALYGAKPEDAFRVHCDEETNSQESQDRGRIIAEIDLAVEPTSSERMTLRVVYFMK